jgi:hypothetical protein
MSVSRGPSVVKNGLILYLDAANEKSFRGESTTNTVQFPGAGATRYNNPGFSGTITNTGETFMGSPIWEVTFTPQDAGRVTRLGSSEVLVFIIQWVLNFFQIQSIWHLFILETDYPLVSTPSQGFSNTYSNISGWGFQGTTTTRIQEAEWTDCIQNILEIYTIEGVNYIDRTAFNTLQATVNTTQTTQVLVTITIQSNGRFSTSTSNGTNTIGGTIAGYSQFVGFRSANPSITNAGGISGLSTGISAIVNHGLDATNWEKMSNQNPIYKTSFPFQYYVLMNIPSTGGNNVNISFRLALGGFYSSVTDNKFWKVTFDTTNLQVNDVIRTYWTAPMIEQHSRPLPSRFIVGSRGTTVATGGGWADRSGSGNHGELINGPFFNSGSGGSIQFDGVDDFIEIPIDIGDTNVDYTINLYFRINSFTGGNDMRLIGSYSGGAGQLATGFTTGEIFRIWLGGSWNNTNLSCEINTNYFFSIVHTGTTTLFYVNGVLNTTINNKNSFFNNMGVGNPFLMANGQYFSGGVFKLAIYDRALEESEIKQTFNATRGRFGL